jgi:putative peptide-modifying radical SAM enzyme
LYYHLILTDECNLCCSYCRAKMFDDNGADERRCGEIDELLPVDIEYDLQTLYHFLQKDPAPTLTFYGGEPLLKVDMIKKIMDDAPVQRFMIQTNGLLLDRLEPGYVNRFSTILVSLDGREALTDTHRGQGTYRRVMRNVQNIIANGYSGELIARMTITEDTDIVDAVTYLADNPDYSFSSIHWQMDADFSNDFSRSTFAPWAHGCYNPGIRLLVRSWIRQMDEHHTVPRWYPFLGTVDDLLNKRPSLLRCGSGHANYTIMTDGHISPCPVMIGMKQYYLGHISTTHPRDLSSVPVGGDCTACRIRHFCGGRCLYANIVHPWNEQEHRVVCGTVENLHAALTRELPSIRSLIDRGVIAPGDFACEKFNGCEIIP